MERFLLFLDNAPSHIDILQVGLRNIRLAFLSKNTIYIKHKYRKLLIRYILPCIDTANHLMDTNIMGWWAEGSENTINTCFETFFGFSKPDVIDNEMVDHEFDELLQELCYHATVKEFL